MAKMPKDQRREQLIDLAMEIVRDKGADELTLATLAARAGVSRPVTYEHFATRPGLLLALFQRLEDNYAEKLRQALAAAPGDLQALADVMSRAYFNCLADVGAEAPAISAALKGTDEMAAQQRAMIDEYVQIMCGALRVHSSLTDEQLSLRCVGILGAAEAMAGEARTVQTLADEAVAALGAMIVGSVV
ncbi:TetR/AcrR family transcriptional regulator [Ensifer sp. ENS09]|uniref:TetR/AcrR family transcriptional regulator n=1 Tax=unclassified Ensifer TaxID=2633371 RepID=UPI001FEFA658|nr:TetR/AcrR family transcriptional regulator [Ensifer sp. ENS09]